MTEADLIRLLSERFHGNFADETARRVRDAGAVDLLYEVATAPHPELPGPVRQKVLFRGAYVLERIYFDAPEAFMPRAESFCRVDFAACANASAQRHFGKIMADLLGRYAPEPGDLERIAETAAGWAVSPEAKVAVKVWAVEVLKRCRELSAGSPNCGTTSWRRWPSTLRRASKAGCAKAGKRGRNWVGAK